MLNIDLYSAGPELVRVEKASYDLEGFFNGFCWRQVLHRGWVRTPNIQIDRLVIFTTNHSKLVARCLSKPVPTTVVYRVAASESRNFRETTKRVKITCGNCGDCCVCKSPFPIFPSFFNSAVATWPRERGAPCRHGRGEPCKEFAHRDAQRHSCHSCHSCHTHVTHVQRPVVGCWISASFCQISCSTT